MNSMCLTIVHILLKTATAKLLGKDLVPLSPPILFSAELALNNQGMGSPNRIPDFGFVSLGKGFSNLALLTFWAG